MQSPYVRLRAFHRLANGATYIQTTRAYSRCDTPCKGEAATQVLCALAPRTFLLLGAHEDVVDVGGLEAVGAEFGEDLRAMLGRVGPGLQQAVAAADRETEPGYDELIREPAFVLAGQQRLVFGAQFAR